MSFIGVTQRGPSAAFGAVLRLRARAAAALSGEHSETRRQGGSAFVIRAVSAGIVFASQALLARWIGASEFGTFVYVWTWLILAGDLVHLGLPLTAQRFVPEYAQAQSDDLLRGFLSGSRWLAFGAGCAVAGLGALIVRALEESLEAGLVLPLYLACGALPVYGLTFMSDGLARSYNWIGLALLPAYIVRPLVFIAAAATLYATGVTLDAARLMGALAAAAWLAALMQVLQFNRRLRGVVGAGPKRYDTRHWFGTALPVLLVWGLYTLLTSTDVLILKQFRPAEEVAHYYAAAKTLALVSIVYFAVAATTAHRFTAFHVAGDREGLERFVAATVRWVFWLSLALTVPMLALGRPVLMLFGPDFAAGYPVMAVLAIGLMARASIGPAERLLTVLGQQRICALAYLAAFAVNFGACVLLAPA